ncbi:unnamed protein product, partial [Closterium sp. NIES-65]
PYFPSSLPFPPATSRIQRGLHLCIPPCQALRQGLHPLLLLPGLCRPQPPSAFPRHQTASPSPSQPLHPLFLPLCPPTPYLNPPQSPPSPTPSIFPPPWGSPIRTPPFGALSALPRSHPPPPNLLITRYQAHANSTTHYPLPPSSLFPTLSFPTWLHLPHPHLPWNSALPSPPPAHHLSPHPAHPPLHHPRPPHLHYSPPTLPLSTGPQPAPPLGPNPLQLSGPLYPLFHPLRTAFPTLFPFPQANPPHPGLCQGVPSPFDALLSQLQQLTPPPPGMLPLARGELAADTAREGVREFVCEGAAEAAEDGAAKAAREGAMGVVGEGSAEAAEERAAEAAREGAAAACTGKGRQGLAREGAAGTTAAVEAARTAAGATEATVGAGIGGGATGAAGKGVTGTGARESAAPAVAREGTAGARVGEGTAVASKAEGEAAAEAAGRAIARPVGAAGAAANAGKHTAGPAGPAETAKGASSKAAAGGEGDVIAIEEDEGEDVMHIDGPLAQYLTLDGEADPAPLQPHVEIPPLPPMPVPMLAEGPMEGLGETLRTEPREGAPILTSRPPAHPPPGAPLPHPHPQVPVVSRGAAKALAFLAEPCSPTPTLLHGQLPSPSPTPDPTVAGGPPGEHAAHLCPHPQGLLRAPRGAARALVFLEEPCSPTPTNTQPPPTGPLPPPPPGPPPTRRRTAPTRPPNRLPSPHHPPQAAETHPQGLAPQAHGSGGTRVEGPTGEATTGPTQISLPPPFVPRSNLHTGPTPRPPPPTPSPGRVPHEWPRWAAITPHTQLARSVPTEGDVSRREGMQTEHPPPGEPPILPPPTPLAPQPPLPSQTGADNQVAAAAIATGREAVGLRDAPMADATDSPSHPSHPFHVDDPLPQPMVIGEGQGGLLGQGPHPSSAQPARPTPPSTLPALLLSPTGRQVFETPEEVRAGISDLLAIHRLSSSPAAPTLPVPQDRTRTYAGVTRSVPSFIPPATQLGASLPTPMETDRVLRPCHSHLDGVAPPPVQPVAQEVTSSRDEASAPTETPPPGVAEPSLEPHPAEGQEHTTAHTSGSPPRPPSPASTPGDPLGAQAAHGVPSTASSDATAPIDPADTATSPDQVVSCPTCRSSLANRRALQHHIPFCHPADAARRAQAAHDTASIIPSLSQPRATGMQFTDAQWQTLDSVDWTEYFSPERIHTRPLRRVPERVRGGYLDVLSAILVRIAQDPEAAGPTFLLAAAPTLFLCAALESAEAAPDTQGTIQRLQSKHPNAERPTPAWLSGFQGSPLVLSVDHLRRAIFTAPRGSSGGPSGWVAEHLRDTFLAFPQSLHFLLAVYQQWLRGRCAPAARSLLASSTLVALAKSNMDVRPIAIGEVLVRILSRAVCLQLRDQMARVFLASQQFGVGVMCGTEVVVRGVRRALADHPDWVVLQLDVANAFNSFHRDRMFQALQASPEFQCLIPFIGLFYGTPSDLHYRSGTGVVTMHSERGTRQGDPLSPFLYALTQRLALEPVLAEGDVQLWSYANDTYVLGPPDRVLHHFAEIVRRLGEMGLAAQPHKCLVYQTESFLSRDLEAFTGLGIEVARRGLTVTGVPVGTVSFVEQSLLDRLERMGRVLPWLPRLRQPQTAARLLSACVSTRPQYLSRTVPPSPAVISSFTRWDARLGETFQQLLASGTWACREDVREAALDQIFLPIRLGGFGIRRMARIAPVSFVCSWVQCAPILCSLPACGEVFRQSFASGEPEQIDRALQTALEGLPPDVLSLLPPWPSCASASPDSLFAGASRLLEAHALEAVRARHASPLHLARLTSLQGGGAEAWLTSVPYADPLRILEALWQAASSSRLGLPIPQLALAGQCSCGQAIDDMTVPHHAVRCPRYGVATTIHDTVKYMLRDFAVEAGFAVKVEDSTLFTQLEAARARLLGQPVVGEGTRAEGPGERRGEAGQPGGGGQWGRHQLRGQVERGTGGQRGRQGEQTGQDGEGGRHRQQQESQWRPRAQGAAPPGSASGAGQGREQQRADGGTGGAAGLGGEGQGVREAAGDGAGGSGGLGEGREGEGRGQVDGGEERGRETIGEGAPRDQTGQQPAQQQGPVGRTGRVGTASRIPDLTCRDVGQGLMVLVDVSIADPQREGNVQLRRATPTQIGVAAARRVQEKLRHWGPHLEGLQPAPHFYACVAETFGLLSEPLRQFLGLCAKRIAQRRRDRGGGDDGSARIFEAGLTTRLSVALHRAQAQCMIQHAVRQLGSHTPCPLMPSAPPAPTLRVPAPLPPLLTLPAPLAVSHRPPFAPPRPCAPLAYLLLPPPLLCCTPLPSPRRPTPLPAPPQSAPCPSYLGPLCLVSPLPAPRRLSPPPTSPLSLPPHSPPLALGFLPPCPTFPPSVCSASPLPAPPSSPPCPLFPPSHARFLPSPRLPFFLRASPLLPPCPRLPMPLSLTSPLPAPRFFPPCPPSAPPLFSPHPLLLPSLPLISRTPALVSYHPCPSFPPLCTFSLFPPCPSLPPPLPFALPSLRSLLPIPAALLPPSAHPHHQPPSHPSLPPSLSLSLFLTHTHAHSPPPPPTHILPFCPSLPLSHPLARPSPPTSVQLVSPLWCLPCIARPSAHPLPALFPCPQLAQPLPVAAPPLAPSTPLPPVHPSPIQPPPPSPGCPFPLSTPATVRGFQLPNGGAHGAHTPCPLMPSAPPAPTLRVPAPLPPLLTLPAPLAVSHRPPFAPPRPCAPLAYLLLPPSPPLLHASSFPSPTHSTPCPSSIRTLPLVSRPPMLGFSPPCSSPPFSAPHLPPLPAPPLSPPCPWLPTSLPHLSPLRVLSFSPPCPSLLPALPLVSAFPRPVSPLPAPPFLSPCLSIAPSLPPPAHAPVFDFSPPCPTFLPSLPPLCPSLVFPSPIASPLPALDFPHPCPCFLPSMPLPLPVAAPPLAPSTPLPPVHPSPIQPPPPSPGCSFPLSTPATVCGFQPPNGGAHGAHTPCPLMPSAPPAPTLRVPAPLPPLLTLPAPLAVSHRPPFAPPRPCAPLAYLLLPPPLLCCTPLPSPRRPTPLPAPSQSAPCPSYLAPLCLVSPLPAPRRLSPPPTSPLSLPPHSPPLALGFLPPCPTFPPSVCSASPLPAPPSSPPCPSFSAPPHPVSPLPAPPFLSPCLSFAPSLPPPAHGPVFGFSPPCPTFLPSLPSSSAPPLFSPHPLLLPSLPLFPTIHAPRFPPFVRSASSLPAPPFLPPCPLLSPRYAPFSPSLLPSYHHQPIPTTSPPPTLLSTPPFPSLSFSHTHTHTPLPHPPTHILPFCPSLPLSHPLARPSPPTSVQLVSPLWCLPCIARPSAHPLPAPFPCPQLAQPLPVAAPPLAPSTPLPPVQPSPIQPPPPSPGCPFPLSTPATVCGFQPPNGGAHGAVVAESHPLPPHAIRSPRPYPPRARSLAASFDPPCPPRRFPPPAIRSSPPVRSPRLPSPPPSPPLLHASSFPSPTHSTPCPSSIRTLPLVSRPPMLASPLPAPPSSPPCPSFSAPPRPVSPLPAPPFLSPCLSFAPSLPPPAHAPVFGFSPPCPTFLPSLPPLCPSLVFPSPIASPLPALVSYHPCPSSPPLCTFSLFPPCPSLPTPLPFALPSLRSLLPIPAALLPPSAHPHHQPPSHPSLPPSLSLSLFLTHTHAHSPPPPPTHILPFCPSLPLSHPLARPSPPTSVQLVSPLWCLPCIARPSAHPLPAPFPCPQLAQPLPVAAPPLAPSTPLPPVHPSPIQPPPPSPGCPFPLSTPATVCGFQPPNGGAHGAHTPCPLMPSAPPAPTLRVPAPLPPLLTLPAPLAVSHRPPFAPPRPCAPLVYLLLPPPLLCCTPLPSPRRPTPLPAPPQSAPCPSYLAPLCLVSPLPAPRRLSPLPTSPLSLPPHSPPLALGFLPPCPTFPPSVCSASPLPAPPSSPPCPSFSAPPRPVSPLPAPPFLSPCLSFAPSLPPPAHAPVFGFSPPCPTFLPSLPPLCPSLVFPSPIASPLPALDFPHPCPCFLPSMPLVSPPLYVQPLPSLPLPSSPPALCSPLVTLPSPHPCCPLTTISPSPPPAPLPPFSPPLPFPLSLSHTHTHTPLPHPPPTSSHSAPPCPFPTPSHAPHLPPPCNWFPPYGASLASLAPLLTLCPPLFRAPSWPSPCPLLPLPLPPQLPCPPYTPVPSNRPHPPPAARFRSPPPATVCGFQPPNDGAHGAFLCTGKPPRGFTRWDARLGETFQQLLASGTWACREDVREAALDQIFLPIRLGGFGIRRMARIALSFASGEPEQIDRALQTALEGLPPDVLSLLPPWPSCASASPDSLFAGASRLLEAHALEAVRARHASPLHLARLTSLQGGGAGAWLTSVPYADPLRIPEALWQAASSSRLGLPIPQLALAGQCSCGQAIDDMTVPHHAVRCPRYGVATTIHDTVKYMLRDFAVEAGFAVKVEDSTLFTQLEAAQARLLGQPVVGEGTRAEGPGERRGEAGQPGGGGQWGRHQLRGQVERGTGGQRGRQGEQTGQDGEGGRHRQQQESQWRPRAQGAAPPGSASGAGQGQEQQRADGGTGGAAGLGGEGQGVREAAGDGAGGSGGLGEGREGEGRGQVDGGEERGRETIGEGAPRDQTGQQPAQQQGPVGRTGRVGTASRIVCEGAAEAAEDGAAKAAREGAMGVVGEGAAEAAEERAAEAAREGAAAAARERAAGAAREGAAGTVTLARQRAEAMETGFAGVGATEPAAVSAGGTAAEEAIGTAPVEAARTAAGATEATVGAGIGGGATGAAGKGVTGTGARESAAPAVAREGTAGATVGEGTAVASKAEGEAAGRAIARPVGAAGAAANAGKHTAGPAGPAETAKGASSKAAVGGVGSGDIGATGEGEGSVVPTGVGTEEGDVIAIEEDEGEDVMHIDGPLAQYLTLDGEADPAPLQPHVEVPPLPPRPVPMLAEGPMEGLGETLRTEPREGAPILTSRPPAHPPPGAPLPHPHPQVPVVSRGAAKALAFLAEPCSPTPTLLHGQPPSPSPTPDPTVAGGPPGEHAGATRAESPEGTPSLTSHPSPPLPSLLPSPPRAAHLCPHPQGLLRAPRGAARALVFLEEPCSPTPTNTQPPPTGPLPPPPPGPPPPGSTHISEVEASLRPNPSPTRYRHPNHPSRRTAPTRPPNRLPSPHHPTGLAPQAHGSGGTRVEGPTGEATTEPTQISLPPPFVPRSNLHTGPAPRPPPPTPSPGRVPHEWPRWAAITPHTQLARSVPTEGDVSRREGMHTEHPPPGEPPILQPPSSLAPQPPLPSQTGADNQVGRRRKNRGRGGRGSAHVLPPPSLPHQEPLPTSHPVEPLPGPTSTARPSNLHSRPAPAPPQGHGSGPAHSPPFCPSRAVSPSQVAAAAIATGREAVGLRDAPMADATDSPSHPSHPFHVDDPLPQPMVIGEGQGGLLGQGPHPSSAQPARPTPPSTLPALLLSPTGRQVFETPEEVRAGISDLLAIHRLSSSPAAPTLPVPQDRTRTYAEVTRSVPSFIPPATQPGASLPTPMETDRVLRPCHSHLDRVVPPPVQPVAQEVTSSRDEASAPTETPPPGVAEPSLEPHPAEGQEHTTAHTSGSPPRPPSPASTPVPARGPALSCATPPLSSLTPPPRGAGESSPPLIPGDPLGAQAAHGVPSTASSDATAPIDPADTATSPDQVVSCPTCRSSLANRRALQHHIPFCHPADVARRAQAAHDTASIIPSLSQPRATGMQFTDAQWQTLDSVDWTEYFSPERIHTRPLRRVPERVRGGYLDVLSAILVRIAQDPEAAGPTFLLAAAPTLFLVPATPPDRSHTAAIATRISRFGRGEWAELVSDALGRRSPLPRRTGHRSRTATDPSTADERRIARCLRLAACNETSRACAALESAEAAPDTQGTIQRLQSKHPNAERPTPAWLSGFQGSPLVLSVDHLRRAIFTAPRGSSGGPSGWVAEHLRDTFLAFPQSLHFLLAVYQQWLRGRCASAARSLLASSTLVALAKSNMDVRPIAIGEVLVRILSRAVCLQLRDQMARVFLASQQFGVGVMCGTEVVVRGVRRALADHPDWVVLQLDVANAFNSFHRDRMFQALQASPEFQCLIPFIGLFYGTPSDLHYRSGTGVVTMHSERGTRQGDPLSPFLYALTQRLALEPVLAEGDVQLWSYADDTYVLGPPDRVLHHFAEIVRRLGEMGLAAQPHKCLVYQTESFLSRDLEAFTGLGIEVARRGLTVTGVPVGTVSFVEQSLPDRLERMGRVLPWLPRLRQPQTAARLLSACVSTRPQYLSRTVPPSPAVISSFTRWDARLGETFQQLLASGTWACREDVREAALDQIFLPIRLGGFGIRRMARIALVSFVCSWVQCAPILCSLSACGEVFRQSFASGEPEQIDRALQTALEGLPPDVLSLLPPWPSCASASPDSLFAGASRLLEAHALEAVRARHASPLHLARLTSLQGGGAGAWLTSVPYADPQRIPEALWQAASSSRLGPSL